MAGYRFCRSDDIPLLVEARRNCFAPRVSGASPLEVEDFKRLAREIQLWASSCLVAFGEDGSPFGVLLAAKRTDESRILEVGVLAEVERQGHARHLVTSLVQKVAILGPPRLVVEVPEAWASGTGFFEACGFERDATFEDWVATSPRVDAAAQACVVALPAEAVLDSGALETSWPTAWSRGVEALRARSKELGAVVLAPADRIEAFALHRPDAQTGGTEVVALGVADESRREALLGLVLGALGTPGGTLTLRGLAHGEVPEAVLRDHGFVRASSTVRLARLGVAA